MHLVNRLRFELRCFEEGLAFEIRQNFAHTLQEQIAEVIDQVCSAYVPEGESLRIDRVEVDLGRLSPQAMGGDFAGLFRQQFAKEFAKQLGAPTADQGHAAGEKSRLESFCHFLAHGILPWWAGGEAASVDELAQGLCARQPRQLAAFFYRQADNPALWLRTAFQLNEESQRRLISLVKELDAVEALLVRWSNAIRVEDAGLGEAAEFLTVARGIVLHQAPVILREPGPFAAARRIAKEAVQAFAPDGHVEARQQVLAALAALASSPEALAAEERGPAGRATRAASTSLSEAAEILAAGRDAQLPHARVTLPEPALLVPAHRSDEGTVQAFSPASHVEARQQMLGALPAHEESDLRHVVHQAGVVLLASFFPRFFDACELLQDGYWRDKAAQYRAVQLLKYLSAGLRKTPEHALTLEKLCCGVAIEEPIPLDAGLETYQLDEAQTLLTAVIKHWKVIKNTSTDGLRETFLKRDGIITKRPDGWLLQVERKTLDVLLDNIPWGYSTVAPPWNDYLIHVEW